LNPKEIAGVVASQVWLQGNLGRPKGQGYLFVGADITKGLNIAQDFRTHFLKSCKPVKFENAGSNPFGPPMVKNRRFVLAEMLRREKTL